LEKAEQAMKPLEGTDLVIRHPMWCDNFDMDLLKVLPEVERLLKPLEGSRLCTTCHPIYG